MATEPLDMRAGTDSVLARVIQVFGAARPHHAYLFADKNGTRMKVLVYDGDGFWLAARRLNWLLRSSDSGTLPSMETTVDPDQLNPDQLRALTSRLIDDMRVKQQATSNKQTLIDKLTHYAMRCKTSSLLTWTP